MSLLRLPPEITKYIFDEISSSFFHEDLGRLTVSKRWFDFALPACLRCITLSQKTLKSLAASKMAEGASTLNDCLETLDLDLGTRQRGERSNVLENAAPEETPRYNAGNVSAKTLNDDLAQLSAIAQQSRRLRALRIRALSSMYPGHLDGPESDDCIPLPTMRAFLSAENLSVLVLDLPGSFQNVSSGRPEDDRHVCPVISAVLGTLRTLHLRMRSSVLSLNLSTVVINLSLATNLPGITSASHSKPCASHQGRGGSLQLKAYLRQQAEVLAARMAQPKAVRILTHSLLGFETQSLDVLTGKNMILDDDMAWDENGKIVKEDSDSESELLDDDFTAYLDDSD